MILALIAFFGSVLFLAYYQSERLLDWFTFRSVETRDHIVDTLAKMQKKVDSQQVMTYLMGAMIVPPILGIAVVFPNFKLGLLIGTVLAVIGWFLPRVVVDHLYKKRVDEFVNQLVDALPLMSSGMKSGLALPQALQLVVREMDGVVKEEFALVMNQNAQGGLSISEAFQNLSNRMKAPEVEILVTAVIILSEVGGGMAEVFESLATTIRERINLQKKIDALTGAPKMNARVMAAIPLLMFVYSVQSDPQAFKGFFESPGGLAVVGIVLLFSVVMFLVLNKIAKIDV